jgi:hypothetical protein
MADCMASSVAESSSDGFFFPPMMVHLDAIPLGTVEVLVERHHQVAVTAGDADDM